MSQENIYVEWFLLECVVWPMVSGLTECLSVTVIESAGSPQPVTSQDISQLCLGSCFVNTPHLLTSIMVLNIFRRKVRWVVQLLWADRLIDEIPAGSHHWQTPSSTGERALLTWASTTKVTSRLWVLLLDLILLNYSGYFRLIAVLLSAAQSYICHPQETEEKIPRWYAGQRVSKEQQQTQQVCGQSAVRDRFGREEDQLLWLKVGGSSSPPQSRCGKWLQQHRQ